MRTEFMGNVMTLQNQITELKNICDPNFLEEVAREEDLVKEESNQGQLQEKYAQEMKEQ
eukprot:CAMPEP_0170565310 /NCGR_PEP_ID=MMETSP0211-20121228/78059_1 /TAXON_ID=311385 /ORGANISM="Pseudokeronopsis sp., Strain OXSARD2" /LENGTH=58 /DNA_ID=CAMNT_0010885945 /DNA_START=579 /DNA_END=755 /DNA_ORIENTATION=+